MDSFDNLTQATTEENRTSSPRLRAPVNPDGNGPAVSASGRDAVFPPSYVRRAARRVAVLGVLAVVIAGVYFAPQVAATVDALTGRASVRDITVGTFPSYASDRLIVDLAGVSAPPQGSSMQGYLLSAEGGFFCGDLPVVNNAISHSVDAQGRNLIGLYDQFQIMQQQTRFDVSLPATALHHLRQVTSSAQDTPEGKGYALGMAEQAELVDTHAKLAQASLNDGNLIAAKQHVEHVLNILYGKFNPEYGDQDGDTLIGDPGDGLGVLFYASQADTVLGVVANAADVTPYMAERVGAAQTAIGNYWTGGSDTTWSTQLISAAKSIINSSSVAEAKTFAPALLGMANRIAFGADLDDNGIVEPIPGEGGALTVFRTAQEAADYFPPTGSGSIGVRQSGSAVANDKLVISLSGITAPASGNQLWGYLVDDDGNHQPLGELTVNGTTATLEKTFAGRDLIQRYSRFYLTEGRLYAEDQLPLNALSQLRIATGSATDTPDNKGYAAGLAEQAALIDTHAKLAQTALAANDLTVAKQHIEHVLNILYGKDNPAYGDQDNDTLIGDPGDGFGVLAYAEKSHGVLGQVATVGDVSPHMAERATAAQTAIGNFWTSGSGDTWSTGLITAAQSILASSTVAEANGFVPALLGMANRLAFGSDLDDDGIVEPIAGEGGALTVFRTAQEAADYFPEQVVAQPTATATPTATPTGTVATATVTTTPPTPGTDNDNSCQNANSLETNGTLRSGLFGAEGDTDWYAFTAQANRTYIIKIENLGPKSDAVVFLYDVCNGPPDDSQDNAFGTTVTLEWDSTKAGPYFIELRQFDPSQFGSDANYRISVTLDTTPPATPKNPRCVAVDAGTQAVQWDRSPERDVVGYRLSYTRRTGGDSGIRNVDGALTTYFELTSLVTGAIYDVVLRSVDYSGNLSDPTAPALPCTVVAPSDTTLPSATIQQPAAAAVFTTTAELVTFSGSAQDSGGNLSRVNVRNVTNSNSEKWDFSLAGGTDQFRVEDIPLVAGANEIRVTVFDDANNSTAKTVTVNRLAGQAGAAIIIAGHNETFGLQTNIYNSTNRAYRVFKSGGFSDENIYYIAPVAQDADGDGNPDTDAIATPAEIEEAITVWAKNKVGPGKPLFIYMMDHGLENKFCVNGCGAGKFITPDDLDGWLRTLETDTGVTEVTVVYEACLSGSFVKREGATGSISKLNRVIITSTGADNNAYASAQGAYFSDAFFSCVADSGNMRACFNEGKDAVLATGVNQTPLLDDNGDGAFNASDGSVAQNRVVTRFFSSVRPTITTADVSRQGTDGTLSATIEEGAEKVELVWAAVFPPGFSEPSDVTLNLNMPVVRLEPVPNQPGQFSILYPNGFPEQGEYRVVFYAQDRLGINAAPAQPGAGQTIFLPAVSR